jgi:hypothetical protein
MVKILMILGTGAILTFPMDQSVIPDCFSQGHSILQKISTYQGSGPDQGWYLKGKPIQVAGWYCNRL